MYNDISSALRENNCQPRLDYPVRISSIMERDIKTSTINKGIQNHHPPMQKILKESYTQEVCKCHQEDIQEKINPTRKVHKHMRNRKM
jgi:hypothetical protein